MLAVLWVRELLFLRLLPANFDWVFLKLLQCEAVYSWNLLDLEELLKLITLLHWQRVPVGLNVPKTLGAHQLHF